MSILREPTPAVDTAKDRSALAPPKMAPRTTRATDARSANKPSKTEIIKDSQSNIKSNQAAKKWLTDYNYIIHGEDLHRTLNDKKNVYQE